MVEEEEVVDILPMVLLVVSRLLEAVDGLRRVPWRTRRPPKRSSKMIDARATRGKLFFKQGLLVYPR